MIYVDPNWTYRESVIKVKKIKSDYVEILSLFSIWQAREKADFIYDVRDQFYALNLQRWQKDNLWKYMNGYLPYYKLERSASRFK